MLTREQKLQRQQGIGASDIGAILGLNPYKSALDVYYEKILPLPEEDSYSENEAITWGNLLEDPIAKRFAYLYNVDLDTSLTLHHPQFPFIMCTPDRLIRHQKVGLEIKTVGMHSMHNWDEDKVPQSYFMQCMHCMYVTDYDSWYLAALMAGQELKVYQYHRDPEFDDLIEEKCCDFWHNNVLKRVPPKIDFAHEATLAALKRVYDNVEDHTIDLDDDISKYVHLWNEAKEHIKQYNQILNAAQAHLLAVMGNSSTGVLPSGSMLIRKEVQRKGFEVKATKYVTLTYKEIDK